LKYLLEIFRPTTKYDEYCPGQRALLHRRIFANGNVLGLRDVIFVISVTVGVFRNNPD